mmetsp:Transcript_2632/g.5503  ORF Transcript_2632/g.5503 Transcript_2632/m.5503 type:complete len:209 (-) Transcript_2632:1115-1741(-)
MRHHCHRFCFQDFGLGYCDSVVHHRCCGHHCFHHSHCQLPQRRTQQPAHNGSRRDSQRCNPMLTSKYLQYSLANQTHPRKQQQDHKSPRSEPPNFRSASHTSNPTHRCNKHKVLSHNRSPPKYFRSEKSHREPSSHHWHCLRCCSRLGCRGCRYRCLLTLPRDKLSACKRKCRKNSAHPTRLPAQLKFWTNIGHHNRDRPVKESLCSP